MKNKTLKKFITTVTAVVLSAGLLAGCGSASTASSANSGSAGGSSTASSSAASDTASSETAEAEDSTSASETESVAAKDGTATSSSSSQAADTKVVVDSMGRSVTIPTKIKSLAILPMPWISVVYALNGDGHIVTGMQQVAKDSFESSMLKKLAPEIEQSNTAFFKDGEFNFEELAKIQPDVMILFESQSKFIDKLTEVGVPCVTIKYADSYDTLWNDFKILGEVLGKEERAQKFIDYQKKDIQYFKDKQSELDADHPVKVLQIEGKDLSVADNSGTLNDGIKYCGGVNVGETDASASSSTQVNMEQIYKWNPDVIFLSNFDDFVPDDFYNNKIDGQDWSNVNAVKNHRVYKIPQGIYRWDADAPATETTLCDKWMALAINPDVFNDYDLKQDVKDFYSEYLNYDLSDSELSTILAEDANANSVPLFK